MAGPFRVIDGGAGQPAPLDPAERRRLLGQIHDQARRAGLEDDAYRALLEQVTGQRSAAVLDRDGLRAVLRALGRLTGTPPRRPASPHPHVRLIHVLWRECAAAGAIRSGSRQALNAWVRRMTAGATQDVEWLPADAAPALIEALKAMKRRGGGDGA